MKEYFYLPTKIVFGYNVLSELGDVVKEFGDRAIVLFSRSFAVKYGYVRRIGDILSSLNIKYRFYIGVRPNPPATQCDEIASVIKDFNADVVVAFGGGSVIDAAKASSVVASLGGKTSNYFYPYVVKDEVIPIIAVPTTCGTGSEVTKYAIITDEVSRRKAVIVGEPLIPKAAIIDPQILTHLPKHMIAWTALDALSHALESYVSRASNSFSDMASLGALELILENIRKGVKYDKHALHSLHLASTLAGIAINVAGTTLIHALGYYLTTHHDIHHGLANAIVMPYVLYRDLKALSEEKTKKLLNVFHSKSVEELVVSVVKLLDALGIPDSVSDVGVKVNELEEYMENVMSYKRNLENNPFPTNKELVGEIIKESFKGRRYFLSKILLGIK